jgi:threonine/homoserine/homoserine lactone efflux protein
MGPEYGAVGWPEQSPSGPGRETVAHFGADPTEWISFLPAARGLLASPGSTNMLLSASRAVAGFKRALERLLAEPAGCLITISCVALVIGPAIAGSLLAAKLLGLIASA